MILLRPAPSEVRVRHCQYAPRNCYAAPEWRVRLRQQGSTEVIDDRLCCETHLVDLSYVPRGYTAEVTKLKAQVVPLR